MDWKGRTWETVCHTVIKMKQAVHGSFIFVGHNYHHVIMFETLQLKKKLIVQPKKNLLFLSCNFDPCIVLNWYDLCIFFPIKALLLTFLPNSLSYIVSIVRDGLLLKFILQRNSISNNKTKKFSLSDLIYHAQTVCI